jgi:hypothetical protein
MIETGNVARKEYIRNAFILVGKLEENRLLGLDGRIILKWILKKWDMRIWTGLWKELTVSVFLQMLHSKQ